MKLFSRTTKINQDRCVSVRELPHTGYKIECITVNCNMVESRSLILSTAATETLRDILNEIDFVQGDEPREEVREKPKHKNHKGRDDR